jgi:predicted GIY-YIG superfamily endonuclease
MTALSDAAEQAPARPGVYFFFGPERGLVYVGKASNLRRRLAQHARPRGGRLDAIYPHVREVRWQELPDDDAAAAREADLILALEPSFNASFAADGRWAYVVLADRGDMLRIELAHAPAAGSSVYGCFPYLGTGVLSRPAIACSDGYAAFLRLLWAAGPAPTGSHFPAAVRGPSPPAAFEVVVAVSLRSSLRRFLGGTSDRLLDELAALAAARDAYMQPGLHRDRAAADGFFRYGPRAIRDLCRRHRVRPPVSRAVFTDLIRAEVEDELGAFGPSPLVTRRRGRTS